MSFMILGTSSIPSGRLSAKFGMMGILCIFDTDGILYTIDPMGIYTKKLDFIFLIPFAQIAQT